MSSIKGLVFRNRGKVQFLVLIFSKDRQGPLRNTFLEKKLSVDRATLRLIATGIMTVVVVAVILTVAVFVVSVAWSLLVNARSTEFHD